MRGVKNKMSRSNVQFSPISSLLLSHSSELIFSYPLLLPNAPLPNWGNSAGTSFNRTPPRFLITRSASTNFSSSLAAPNQILPYWMNLCVRFFECLNNPMWLTTLNVKRVTFICPVNSKNRLKRLKYPSRRICHQQSDLCPPATPTHAHLPFQDNSPAALWENRMIKRSAEI